jgi:hypothetical protein
MIHGQDEDGGVPRIDAEIGYARKPIARGTVHEQAGDTRHLR